MAAIANSKNVTTDRPDPSLSPLMTTREVAEYLRVPVTSIYEWRKRGDGPRGFKVGRAIRYRREDVEAWLEERES